MATLRRPSLAAGVGVSGEAPTISPSTKAPGIPPLRIRIPGPEDSGPRDLTPLAYVEAEPLGADEEPSFPPGGLRDHFAEPPPPTEERITDPGFATGDPPPLLRMPGSSLRSMLATPVEVALEDDPPPPPLPVMGGSPLLNRAAGVSGNDSLLARARASGPTSPWDAQPPELWREGRPSGPVSIDEDMRMGGRISTDGTGEARRDRPSLASEGRVGRASLHDLNKQAKQAEGKRRTALLVLLMALSLLLLVTVHPGLLRGEAPRMDLPELSLQGLPWFSPPTPPAFEPSSELTLPGSEGAAAPQPAPTVAPAPVTPPVTAPSAPPKEERSPQAPPPTEPTGQVPSQNPPVGPVKVTPDVEDKIRSKDESVGVLVVHSQPQAMIYVNGRYLGLSPIEREELPPGPYVVSAIVSGLGRQRQEVRIEATLSKELSFDFR